MEKRKFRIYFNAPITLGFVGICVAALILQNITAYASTFYIFSTYGSSLLDPLTYVRLIGHVFGHADINHLVSNMMYILLLGPILEEKYKDRLIVVIIITALVTGIVHNIVAPDIQLLGASGVVFAFILLSSITGDEYGIPVTLIIVAIMWIGGEIYDGLMFADSISQLTHILGGLVGAVVGMLFKHN
ncbi:MAG: rhomboid family intramembrane serine protease [Erysipelotrichaceae bacterium]|nr:rhomboid family intramembrane serine protease [Erysipelotrichaceae bacterium]